MGTLSADLRKRIVDAYDRGDGTREQIARRYEVSLGMVKKLLQQRARTGDIGARHANSGRRPTIKPQHERQLKRLVREQPDMTLEELRDAVGLPVTVQAIHYALGRLGLQLKKSRSAPQR
jgi:transposase